MSLSLDIKDYAQGIGCDHVGITSAEGFSEYLRGLQGRYEIKAKLALKSFLSEVDEGTQLPRKIKMDDGYIQSNEDEIVRAYVAWVLGRVGGEKAMRVLEEALNSETSKLVIGEIKKAINNILEKKRREELCQLIL